MKRWSCPPTGLPSKSLIQTIRRRGVFSPGDRNLQRQVVTRLFVEPLPEDAPDHHFRTGREIFEISEMLDIPVKAVVESLRDTIRYYESLLPDRGKAYTESRRRGMIRLGR